MWRTLAVTFHSDWIRFASGLLLVTKTIIFTARWLYSSHSYNNCCTDRQDDWLTGSSASVQWVEEKYITKCFTCIKDAKRLWLTAQALLYGGVTTWQERERERKEGSSQIELLQLWLPALCSTDTIHVFSQKDALLMGRAEVRNMLHKYNIQF